MPPKAKAAGKSGAAAAAVDDEGMQALVLADLFDKPGLAPFTLDTPAALVPIANVPAIEYTLEFLAAQTNLTEILIFSSQHVAKLRAYLASSRWSRHIAKAAPAAGGAAGGDHHDAAEAPTAVPRIRILTSPGVYSAGDAFRAIDSMALVRADTFLLVDGPAVVSNARLDAAIAAHAARNKEDSNAVLTAIVAAAGDAVTPPATAAAAPAAAAASRHAPLATALRLVVSPADGKVHAYDTVPVASAVVSSGATGSSSSALFKVPAKIAKADASAAVRLDLRDTRVYVCSPAVLVHFSDNMDYRCIRDQYIHNEVANVDMGWRFNAHVVTDAYVMPVTDARSLATATRDVCNRWAAPLAPQFNWAAPPLASVAGGDGSAAAAALASWTKAPGGGANCWVQSGATVHPSAALANGTFVFAGASVGAGARLVASVIGPGAAIGEGASLVETIIGAGTTVGAAARLQAAIVGAGVAVGNGATVNPGAVLGDGVRVADGHAVPSFARVTALPVATGKEEDVAAAAASTGSLVGVGGVGRAWPLTYAETAAAAPASDDDDSDSDDDRGAAGAASTAAASTPAGSGAAALLAAARALHGALAAYNTARSGSDAAATHDSHVALGRAAKAAFAQHLLATSSATGVLEAALPHLSSAPLRTRAELAAAEEAAAAKKAADAAAAAGAAAVGGAGTAGSPGSSAGAPAALPPAIAAFRKGVEDIVRGRDNGATLNPKNAALEVKSFKYAENRSLEDCIHAIMPVLLDMLATSPAVTASGNASGGGPAFKTPVYLKEFKRCFEAWTPLLMPFRLDAQEELAVVVALETYCTAPDRKAVFAPLFGIMLHVLYDLELATDVAIGEWAELRDSAPAGSIQEELRKSKHVVDLMEMLDEDTDDEDEDGDEEDDEEDEDD